MIDSVLDVVRKEAESCDCLQGMSLCVFVCVCVCMCVSVSPSIILSLFLLTHSHLRQVTHTHTHTHTPSHKNRLPAHALDGWWYRCRYGHPPHLQDPRGVPRPCHVHLLHHPFPQGVCVCVCVCVWMYMHLLEICRAGIGCVGGWGDVCVCVCVACYIIYSRLFLILMYSLTHTLIDIHTYAHTHTNTHRCPTRWWSPTTLPSPSTSSSRTPISALCLITRYVTLPVCVCVCVCVSTQLPSSSLSFAHLCL